MCLFFVSFSMAYRAYPRSRIHASIVSGISQKQGIFNNPIQSDCDRYIRVWAKGRCSLLPVSSSRPSSRAADSNGRTERCDRTIRLAGSETGRKKRQHGKTKRRLENRMKPGRLSPRSACRGAGRENARNSGCLPVISVAFCVRFAISVYINHIAYIIVDTENDFLTNFW